MDEPFEEQTKSKATSTRIRLSIVPTLKTVCLNKL